MHEHLQVFKEGYATVQVLHQIFEKKEHHYKIFQIFQNLSYSVIWKNKGITAFKKDKNRKLLQKNAEELVS